MAKILIADDERDIRDLVAFALRFAGYEVITTSNGEEAVQAVLEEAPDLILLDVRMPRMTGYEACRQIKEQPGTQDIPIVFLSAKGQEAEVNAGLQLGAVEYIVKPFSPDDLLTRVKAILRNHRT
jgi:DNA-binding response OmpR family regulator